MERKHLIGSWRHSHEEDSAEGLVYRPASFAFPPSRGRHGFELRKDGTAVDAAIAPADGNVASPATWTVDPDGAIVLSAPSGQVLRRLVVISATKNKLVTKAARERPG